MNRSTLLLLAGMLTLGFFSACGSGTNEGANPDGDFDKETQTEAADDDIPDGDTIEGDTDDGDTTDGDTTDDDTTDDDTTDGDTTDGNTTEEVIWYDPISGLTWQNPPADNGMNWEDAKDYCANLNLDGHDDWRLPSISELRSLIRGCQASMTGGPCGVTDSCLGLSCRGDYDYWDYLCGCTSASGGGPADGCYWPGEMKGVCNWYWSSSPVQDVDGRAWHVYFFHGAVEVEYSNTTSGGVRCVRDDKTNEAHGCSSDLDCGGDRFCDLDTGICRYLRGLCESCVKDQDCAGTGAICLPSGVCGGGYCTSNADCLEGACLPVTGLTGGNQCQIVKGTGETGQPCCANSDCNTDQVCYPLSRKCTNPCTSSANCPSGYICNDDSADTYGGYCAPACSNDGDCPSGEICFDSQCVTKSYSSLKFEHFIENLGTSTCR